MLLGFVLHPLVQVRTKSINPTFLFQFNHFYFYFQQRSLLYSVCKFIMLLLLFLSFPLKSKKEISTASLKSNQDFHGFEVGYQSKNYKYRKANGKTPFFAGKYSWVIVVEEVLYFTQYSLSTRIDSSWALETRKTGC